MNASVDKAKRQTKNTAVFVSRVLRSFFCYDASISGVIRTFECSAMSMAIVCFRSAIGCDEDVSSSMSMAFLAF